MSSPNKNMIARKKELPLQDDSSNLFLQIMISIAVFFVRSYSGRRPFH